MAEFERLIICGLNNVTDIKKASQLSAAIASKYAEARDIIYNRITVSWENNNEAVAWSDPRKKLIYNFEK